jgi:hypothetical protein
MIGLSVSFCVRDIAAGKVNLDEVEEIIAGTRVASWRRQKHLIRIYLRTYWQDNAEACEKVYRQLVSNTKRAMRGVDPKGPIIVQPRLYGRMAPMLARTGHWIDSIMEIQW